MHLRARFAPTERPVGSPSSTNVLLDQLPEADRARLTSHGSRQDVQPGTILVDIGDILDALYFPLSGLVSVEQVGGLEVTVAGREGMFGWSAIAALPTSPYRAVVRDCGGVVLRIPLAAVHRALAESEALHTMLWRYLCGIVMQAAEATAAHSLQRVEARVSRWLLIRHDRIGGDIMLTQHDQIAANIGARRASVTDCLHILEGEGDIRCRRGRILIRNRAALEARANGCYGIGEAHYRSCFGPFGKSAAAT